MLKTNEKSVIESATSKVYIHYGASNHNSSLEAYVSETSYHKPEGLITWASPVECGYSWEEWCEDEQFRDCDADNSFKFTLSEEANILVIDKDSMRDVESRYKTKSMSGGRLMHFDWAEVAKEYDGVELIMYGDQGIKSLGWEAAWDYSIWDVDSIAIWKPSIIIPYSDGGENIETKET